MNVSPGSAFYSLIAVALLWLVLLGLGARLKIKRRSRTIQALFGTATVLLVFVPFGGVPLWNRAFSLYPNPSLPMLGVICAALWQRLFGIPVFKPADWRATWIFGAVAGSALYLHPMLLYTVDLYYWGWERLSATACLAGLAIVFLALGNRLGVLFLSALIAYSVNALESQNGWDYLMDPFYWIISLGMLAMHAVGAGLRQIEARRPVPPPAIVPLADFRPGLGRD